MYLDTLPTELLLHIFGFLPSKAVVGMLKTSKCFKELCELQSIWRSLCFKRWHSWNQNPNEIVTKENLQWKILYIRRHLKDKELIEMLDAIPIAKTTIERLDTEKRLLSFGREGLERMRKIQFEGTKNDHLTRKYFAKKICQQFNLLECVEKWKQHLQLPEEERKLEDGAIIIAQTLGFPRLDAKAIHKQLDIMGQEALNRMGGEPNQERRFEIFNKYFFQDLGFKGMDSEEFCPSRSHIHHVLHTRKGIQISVALVYTTIARRVSIPIKMIGMPRHFLTRYDGEGKYKNHYVDVFAGGEILSTEDLEKRSFQVEHATVNNSTEVYSRLLRNLIEEFNGTARIDDMLNALNQSIFISPGQEELAYRILIHADITGNVQLAKQDLELLVSLGSITVNGEQTLRNKVMEAEKRMEQEVLDAQKPAEVKMRGNEILYSVGHVFRHCVHQYRGVIYGWHETCPEEGLVFVASGEEASELGTKQPFYNVLIDTRDRPPQTAIVAQQHIRIEPGDVIQHPEMGFYFEAFRAGNYIPNKKLRQSYPFDSFSQDKIVPMVQTISNGTKRTASVLY